MKKEFGKLKGISVYKVDKFDNELRNQGFIQVIDDGDKYWKICTTSKVADGIYDSYQGYTSIYDEEEFNKNIEQLLYYARRYRAEAKPTPARNLTEECVECLLPELDTIIDEIMSSVGIACDDLLGGVEDIEAVG